MDWEVQVSQAAAVVAMADTAIVAAVAAGWELDWAVAANLVARVEMVAMVAPAAMKAAPAVAQADLLRMSRADPKSSGSPL